MTQTIQEKIAEIQARLDTTSSDPKWLNDAMADLAAAAADVTTVSPLEAGLAEMLTGNRMGNMEYADVCASQALMGLLPRWIGHELHNSGKITLADARASLQRLCGWATLAGHQMEMMRNSKKESGSVPMPTKRPDDAPDDVEDKSDAPPEEETDPLGR
jgi:hypothetical protein